jgi:hypothetical protein
MGFGSLTKYYSSFDFFQLFKTMGTSMMVHTCNPRYSGGRNRSIRKQTREKLETIRENKLKQKGLEV